MWAILTSKLGLAGIALVGVLAIFGIQEVRLKLAQHGEATAKASLSTASASLKASEMLRIAEFAKATAAVSDAEKACAGRIATAIRSGSAIRTIVEKPVATDPTTHCPVRALVGAGELRDALQPGT